MSLFDTALNIASKVALAVPGYGTAASMAIDLAHKVWNMAEPMVKNFANDAVQKATSDWSPQQQAWAKEAIDQVI